MSFVVEIIILFFTVILAGFFSSVEIAVRSIGDSKIEELKEIDEKTSLIFQQIKNRCESIIGALSLIVSLLSVSAAFITVFIAEKTIILFSEKLHSAGAVLQAALFFMFVILLSFLMIVFVILIPKSIGFKFSERITKFTAKPLFLIAGIFKIPVLIITKASNLILSLVNEKANFSRTKFSEDEIRLFLSEGVKSGEIDETEHEIIENVFEFNDLTADEVMIPRTEMIAVDISGNEREIIRQIIKTGYSLVPVYENSIDNIIGLLHTKDLMKKVFSSESIQLRSLLRPAFFVPSTKLISEILKEMQSRGERMAVVSDEYGGTEGVITIEDILEEIVGRFSDSSVLNRYSYNKLDDGIYYLLGSMQISDFNEIFNFALEESDEYNTIAGFVAEKSGKILNTGECFEYNGLIFELIKKIRQKMVQFKIYSNSFILNDKPD